MKIFKKIGHVFHLTIVIMLSFCLIGTTAPSEPIDPDDYKSPSLPMELRVNREKGARLFYSNMLLAPSVIGRFFFFKNHIVGGRQRIFNGPSPGKKYSGDETCGTGKKTFVEKELSSGIEYVISYEQILPGEWVVVFSFTLEKQIDAAVEFEILTLSDDLFRNGKLVSTPYALSDAGVIPGEPRRAASRFLLKNKKSIWAQGMTVALEITALDQSPSIGLADFRSIDWATFKGLYFYASKSLLLPGKPYHFSYRIRLLPRATEFNPQDDLTGQGPQESPTEIFLKLPKERVLMPGYFEIPSDVKIYGDLNGSAEQILQQKLFKEHSIASEILPLPEPSFHGGIVIDKSSPGDNRTIPEGFLLDIRPGNITITGQDERGCLYGVWALLAEIKNDKDRSFVCCSEIRDWPDIAHRGLCMSSDFVPAGNKDLSLYKRYLEAISRSRGNFIAFYHKPAEVRLWSRDEKHDKYWSIEEMIEIVEYARFLKLDIWAGMISKFDRKQFPELDIVEGTNIYNPMDRNSYQVLFSLYNEIIDLYHPSYFIIGHDEIKGLLNYSDRYNLKSTTLFLGDIINIHAWLNLKGVKTAMWGDMLLNHKSWEFDAPPANSGNDMLHSGPTHLCLARMPKDILILDWHYIEKEQYKSIDFFMDQGLGVMGVSYHAPGGARSMASSIKYYGARGMMGTNWGFWRTLSPGSTSLYALLCAWSVSLLPDSADNDVALLGDLLRPGQGQIWENQTPISLNTVFNNTTWDDQAADGRGFLDLGPVLDLRQLPTGRQRLGNIMVDLPKEPGRFNCLMLEKDDNRNSREMVKTIFFEKPFNADAIAFFHTFYDKEPSSVCEEIGGYSIGYSDGSFEKIKLITGWNITDLRSNPGIRDNPWSFARRPEILIGSELAWCGQSQSGMDLNLQMFPFQNPFPERSISSIQMVFNPKKRSSKLILLAMTALSK